MNDSVYQSIRNRSYIKRSSHMGTHEVLSEEELYKNTVKECINRIKRRYMGDNNREDMEVRRCIEDIKEHFGIEV